MQLRIYPTKTEVAQAFADYLLEKIAQNEVFHLALSGGSTPKLLFDILALKAEDEVDWNRVHLYWGDERCVPPEDEESNYRMTVTHLLSKIQIPPNNIHRIHGEADPAEEAKRYSEVLERQLPEVNKLPQFDLVILGMGDDGHAASIFPDEISLWDNLENCVVATHPSSGQKRISITGKLINNAKQVALLVTGTAKADKLFQIFRKKGEYRLYPASLVRGAADNTMWFADTAAAQQLIEAP